MVTTSNNRKMGVVEDTANGKFGNPKSKECEFDWASPEVMAEIKSQFNQKIK